MTKEQIEELGELAKPLMKFLAENGTQHDCIIIRLNMAAYMVGVAGVIATEPKGEATKEADKA
jgi:hypothetical protein